MFLRRLARQLAVDVLNNLHGLVEVALDAAFDVFFHLRFQFAQGHRQQVLSVKRLEFSVKPLGFEVAKEVGPSPGFEQLLPLRGKHREWPLFLDENHLSV